MKTTRDISSESTSDEPEPVDQVKDDIACVNLPESDRLFENPVHLASTSALASAAHGSHVAKGKGCSVDSSGPMSSASYISGSSSFQILSGSGTGYVTGTTSPEGAVLLSSIRLTKSPDDLKSICSNKSTAAKDDNLSVCTTDDSGNYGREQYGPGGRVRNRLYGRRRKKRRSHEQNEVIEPGEPSSKNPKIKEYFARTKKEWHYKCVPFPLPQWDEEPDNEMLEHSDGNSKDVFLTCVPSDFELMPEDDGNDYFEFYIDERLLRIALKDAMWFSARSVSLRFIFLRSADFWPPAPLGSRALRSRRILLEGIAWERFQLIVNELRRVKEEYGEPVTYLENEMLREVKIVDASGLLPEICVGAALNEPAPGLYAPIRPLYGLAGKKYCVEDKLFTRLLDIEASRRSERWINAARGATCSDRRSEVGLLSLPEPFLIRVIGSLDSDDVNNVANACRRLRKIVSALTSEVSSSTDSLISQKGSSLSCVAPAAEELRFHENDQPNDATDA